MHFLVAPILKVLKGYLIQLASEEFIKWAILELAEAAVKSSKTKIDDEAFKKFKEILEEKK